MLNYFQTTKHLHVWKMLNKTSWNNDTYTNVNAALTRSNSEIQRSCKFLFKKKFCSSFYYI